MLTLNSQRISLPLPSEWVFKGMHHYVQPGYFILLTSFLPSKPLNNEFFLDLGLEHKKNHPESLQSEHIATALEVISGSQPCLDFETTKFMVPDDTSSQWSRTSGRECQTPAVSSSCVMSCIISLQRTCPSCLVSSALAAAPFLFSVPWTFQGWSRCTLSALIVPSLWKKLHVPFSAISFKSQPKANSIREGFCLLVLGTDAVVMHMLGKLSIIELHLQLYRGLHSLMFIF